MLNAKELIAVGTNSLTHCKSEDGKLYAHTTFFDDAALAQNKRLKDANLIDKAKLGLHDNEDLRCWISCPSVLQWNNFSRDYPDIVSGLNSRVEAERIKATDQIAILKPAWIVQKR